MYRAIIADDEELIRRGMKRQIESMELNIEVIGTVSDGCQLLELLEVHEPELLLIDINMPFVDGIECIRRIREKNAFCGIIIVSGYDYFEYAQKAIQYNVDYYFLKPVDDEEFKEIVVSTIKKYNQRMDRYHLLQKFLPETNSPENVVSYIKQHYTDSTLSIERLEKQFNMSRTTLFRTIKAATGKSFIEMLTSLRMGHAARLLKESQQYSIKGITDVVGYTDQHYFSRAFKNYYGISPRKYRENS